MIFQWFNKSLDKEKEQTKERLVAVLDKEIHSIKSSIQNTPSDRIGQKDELHKLMASLIVRKALAEFESEEIIKKRMDMRVSFFALVMSSLSLLFSIATFMLRR